MGVLHSSVRERIGLAEIRTGLIRVTQVSVHQPNVGGVNLAAGWGFGTNIN